MAADNLSLGPTYCTTKVKAPRFKDLRYKQDLKYEHRRLVLNTGPIPCTELTIADNSFGKYMKLPVSKWLRKQFDTVEEYVTLNISLPQLLKWQARDEKDTPYKAIWDGDSIMISVSKWCKVLQSEKGELTEIDASQIANGTCEVFIPVEGIYFGPHKDNKLASISLRVQQIIYKPLIDSVDAIIEDILATDGGATFHHAKRRCKRKII